MLNFMLETPQRFLNAGAGAAEPGMHQRAPADRRAVKGEAAPAMPAKRRRHDNLYQGNRAPLVW
jgi:hypothetical protein